LRYTAAAAAPAAFHCTHDMSTHDPQETWQSRFHQMGLQEMQRLAGARPTTIAAKRFWFLRHGETEGNATRIIQHAEIPLNANGFAQAERAAQALKDQPFTRIFGSTMTRAWQTAEAVARVTAKPLTPEPRLRERWFGDLVGTTSVGLNWSIDPSNGDRLADFVERTCACAQDLLAIDEPTLLVAHGGNLYALAMSLGATLELEYIANATPLLFEQGTDVQGRVQWRISPLALPAPDGKVLLPS